MATALGIIEDIIQEADAILSLVQTLEAALSLGHSDPTTYAGVVQILEKLISEQSKKIKELCECNSHQPPI